MIFTMNELSALKRVSAKAKHMGIFKKVDCFESLADILSEIPVTTKDDLIRFGMEQGEEFLNRGILFSETSGTTGQPLLTPRCQEDLEWNTNNQMLAYKRHIQPAVDRVAIVHPGVLSPFVEASALALKNLGVGFVRLYAIPKVCSYERMLSVLRRNQITTIMTTPTLAYKLIYEVSLLDPEFTEFPVNNFLLTGEHISPACVSNIRGIIGSHCSVIPFVYGSSEAATLMYGMPDCTYKPIKEDFIFELVDPQTNQPIDKSKEHNSYTGKLLVTWLRDGLLPIMRYDTKDLFRVFGQEGDEKWLCTGRIGSNSSEKFDQLLVEQLIYDEDINVYHFHCSVKGDCANIEIISDRNKFYGEKAQALTSKIQAALKGEFQIEVLINPNESDFYEFNLSPKMSKFKFSK